MVKFRWLVFLVCVALVAPVSAQDADEVEAGEVPSEGKHKIVFDPFYLSLMKRGRVLGQVDLRLVLVLHEGNDYEEIANMTPQIRSDFTIALTDLARKVFDVNRPIDPDLVSAYLTPFVDRRIGRDRVDVFVQHALIEPK
tara:strand:+ start:1047 stop:1466 length:420 start_codon:yes stop_codon:yes gene_type:complete